MTHVGLQRHSPPPKKSFLIAQHVSGDTPPIIRSSKTIIAASGFTYFFWLPVAAAMAQASQ
jgi:hypothetical protein